MSTACRPVPRIPETLLSERTARQVILGLHRRLTWFVYRLYDIACGKDIKMFILVITIINSLHTKYLPTYL